MTTASPDVIETICDGFEQWFWLNSSPQGRIPDMIDKKFRRLMLECPEVVRASVLSGKQLEIAQLVHRLPTPIYSRDIADRMDISVQNASTQLSRLVKAGYVKRIEVTAPSGGIEYEYMPLLN